MSTHSFGAPGSKSYRPQNRRPTLPPLWQLLSEAKKFKTEQISKSIEEASDDELAVRNQNDDTILRHAISHECPLPLIVALLKRPVVRESINTFNELGISALMMSARCSGDYAVKLIGILVQNGADLTLRRDRFSRNDISERTPLEFAEHKRNMPVIRELLYRGAHPGDLLYSFPHIAREFALLKEAAQKVLALSTNGVVSFLLHPLFAVRSNMGMVEVIIMYLTPHPPFVPKKALKSSLWWMTDAPAPPVSQSTQDARHRSSSK